MYVNEKALVLECISTPFLRHKVANSGKFDLADHGVVRHPFNHGKDFQPRVQGSPTSGALSWGPMDAATRNVWGIPVAVSGQVAAGTV